MSGAPHAPPPRSERRERRNASAQRDDETEETAGLAVYRRTKTAATSLALNQGRQLSNSRHLTDAASSAGGGEPCELALMRIAGDAFALSSPAPLALLLSRWRSGGYY